MAKGTQSPVTGLRSSSHEVFKKELPEAGNEWTTFSGSEASEPENPHARCRRQVFGDTENRRTIWAYRFLTDLQAALLRKDSSFSLDTHTPALNITASSDYGYSVKTPRGTISTRHVVHAEGSWTTHLLKNLDSKISQARWHMTAQAAADKVPDAGQWPALGENGSKPGGRAWGLWRDVYGSMV